MKISHFGGVVFCNKIDDFLNVMKKRYGNDVNEFWITDDETENPCLAILVNGELANVTFFPRFSSFAL